MFSRASQRRFWILLKAVCVSLDTMNASRFFFIYFWGGKGLHEAFFTGKASLFDAPRLNDLESHIQK